VTAVEKNPLRIFRHRSDRKGVTQVGAVRKKFFFLHWTGHPPELSFFYRSLKFYRRSAQ
jgi:hypothetical protein